MNIRSIQWFLPILLIIIGLFGIFSLGAYKYLNEQQQLEKNTVSEIRRQMSRLQARLADNLNQGDFDAAQREIAHQGVDFNIEELMLVNQQGKVILSMHYSELGQPVNSVYPDFIMPDKDIRLGFLQAKADHRLLAYYPILVQPKLHALRSFQHSWLFMSYDSSFQHRLLLHRVKFDVIVLAMGIVLISLLIWWILKRTIVNRVIEYSRVARQIGEGNHQVHATDSWFIELSLLAQSMNQMAENLHHTKLELIWDAEQREQLIQQLEDKNSELERFAYTVSHDLKSPLVTVKGFIGLLKQDLKNNNSEAIESDLSQIAFAADKMAILLDDVLHLSRIGRVVNAPQKISLHALFKEAASLLTMQIQQSGAQIYLQPDMPEIFADKPRMQEVALNLLDNAIKFRKPDQAPQISVTAEHKKTQVVCCVGDNGIGINPAYHEKIFDLFDRLDLSVEGTGIGLALVKRIIEVHNGSLTVDSAGDGLGTSVCFSLPVSSKEIEHD